MSKVKPHLFLTEATHSYSGPVTDQNRRIGYGRETYNYRNNDYQKYYGQFLHNNFHTQGSYFIKKDSKTFIYGSFHCNKLEGYGQVVYTDGSTFEGLFNNHKRFGPGVHTNSNKTQDVGLWKGFQLMRLLTSIRGLVPKIIQSNWKSAKLLKYRIVVPVCEKRIDKAQQILDELGIEDGVDPEMLYNLDMQEPTSSFFHKAKYDRTNDCTIDVEDDDTSLNAVEEYLQESRNVEINEEQIEQLVSQIHMAEKKLAKLTAKRNSVLNKIKYCEMCCQKIRDAKSEAEEPQQFGPTVSFDDIPEEILPESPFEHQEEVNYFLNYSSKLSECELSHYVYDSNIKISMSESNLSSNKAESSTGSLHTLKEEQFQEAPSAMEELYQHQPEEQEEKQHSEVFNEIDEPIGEVKENKQNKPSQHDCQCDAMCIENIDSLKKTLEVLDEEDTFYMATLSILTWKLNKEFAPLHRKHTKTVEITDLLAWNNEELSIELLKHIFRHHRHESNVSFNVKLLLIGDRESFSEPGDYETNCLTFLQACAEGLDRKVFQLLTDFNINPDICDVHGNGGMMHATVKDRKDVIHVLAKVGAKVDLVNDEGLTPLTLAILQYLTYKMKVNCWEKGFLAETKIAAQELGQIQTWRPHQSLVSTCIADNDLNLVISHEAATGCKRSFSLFGDTLQSTDEIKRKSETKLSDTLVLKAFDDTKEQNYIFDWDYKIRREASKSKENKKKKGKKPKSGKSLKKTVKKGNKSNKSENTSSSEAETTSPESVVTNKEEQKSKEEAVIIAKLDTIKTTIRTLLLHCSDPNVGQVPYPALVLAIFTKDVDLLKILLEHGAHPNTTTAEENLTCLHILTSLSPCEEHVQMIETLLFYKADPNLKTNNEHWHHLRKEFLGDTKESNMEETEEKNPLHILCSREDYGDDSHDFFGSAARVLIENGCRTNDLYLGHTPLSLAILKNNTKLVTDILNTKLVNPYRILGNGMGNVFTILILKRFNFEEKAARDAIDILIRANVNPLKAIGDYPNVIHFAENEFCKSEEKKKKKNNVKGQRSKKNDKRSVTDQKSKKKAEKSVSGRKSKKSSKKKKSKRDSRLEVAKYLTEMTRKVLLRHIQGKAVLHLYNFITEFTENMCNDSLIESLAQFVTPEEAFEIIKLFFSHQKLSLEQCSYKVVEDMLEFISLRHDYVYNPEKRQDMLLKIRHLFGKPHTKSLRDYDLLPPEIDDDHEENYLVCFHCLKRFNELLTCPRCELIYYCSEQCRNLNQTLYPGKHKCVVALVSVKESKNKLEDLVQMMRKACEIRLTEFEMKTLEELMQSRKHPSKANKKKIEELKVKITKLNEAGEKWAKEKKLSALRTQSDEIINEAPDQTLKKASLEVVPQEEKNKLFVPRIRHRSDFITQIFSSATFSKSITYSDSTITEEIIEKKKNKTLRKSVLFGHTDGRKSGYDMYKADEDKEHKRMKGAALHQDRAGNDIGNGMRNQKMPHAHYDDLEATGMVNQMLNEGYHQDKGPSRRLMSSSHYITLLSKAFEGFNLPLSLLPYTCLKDGQMFYCMDNSPHFLQYFHQLKLK